MMHHAQVPADAAGTRLDVWLEQHLLGAGLTRSLITRLIKDGRCTIAPGRAKPGYRVQGGEAITLEVPASQPIEARPEDIPLEVLFEDDQLIAVSKPPGMVVHPSVGHLRGTLVNALLWRFGWRPGEDWSDTARFADRVRPGLVHRLDAQTSGVIVVAKSVAALARMQASFAQRAVRKRYLAFLAGSPRSDYLSCAAWLGRHPKDFRKRAVWPDGTPGARAASTSFVIRSRHKGFVVAEARPLTGRQHQIRVHAAHLGHAIIADGVYGRAKQWPPAGEPQLTRHALHAWTLELPHPTSGTMVNLYAPIPADMAALIGSPLPQPLVAPGRPPGPNFAMGNDEDDAELDDDEDQLGENEA